MQEFTAYPLQVVIHRDYISKVKFPEWRIFRRRERRTATAGVLQRPARLSMP